MHQDRCAGLESGGEVVRDQDAQRLRSASNSARPKVASRLRFGRPAIPGDTSWTRSDRLKISISIAAGLRVRPRSASRVRRACTRHDWPPQRRGMRVSRRSPCARRGPFCSRDIAAPPMNLLGPELVRDLVSLSGCSDLPAPGRPKRIPGSFHSGGCLVAGAGFEPATSGL
jgi:hypothetical protein